MMDCKLGRVPRESERCSAVCVGDIPVSLMTNLTEHVDSDASFAPPLPWNTCFFKNNYAHARTVYTRPFFARWEGPGYEANDDAYWPSKAEVILIDFLQSHPLDEF